MAQAGLVGPAVSETHISTVFFAGDRVYKLLKPVRTSFLDHSTVERRLRAADDELTLNRRLAPDVYLGTADVVEQGTVTDRFIVMQRLPSSRRLASLLVDERDDGDCLRSIARQVATFHAAEAPALDADEVGSRDAVAANWAGNFTDLERWRGDTIEPEAYDRIHQLVDRYLTHRDPLFRARIADGLVRDGHGDLTAEDIFCLDDGPRILDCLAFDRRLRVADVLADVAFLAMDIERLVGPGLAERFLAWYSEFSNEHHPSSLAHHYIAYRAHVRAKVASIRFGQGDTAAASSARTYHDLCRRHLEKSRIQLVVVGGSPGTGKTTLARSLSDPLEAMVLSTDELRKDLAGRGHLDRELAPVDEGIYSPTMSDRTYAVLIERAETLLGLGRSVVLDASWTREEHRSLARSLAARVGADLTELECVVPAAQAKIRVAKRLEAGTDPSDARPELVDKLRRRFEPWPEAQLIDTSESVEEATAAALDALKQHPMSAEPGERSTA